MSGDFSYTRNVRASASNNAPRPESIAEVPREVIQNHVAPYLANRDLASLSATSNGLRNTLHQELHNRRAHQAVANASRVDTAVGLQNSLQEIGALQPPSQVEPLQQLMQQVQQLPMHDREFALTDLTVAVDGLNQGPGAADMPGLANVRHQLEDLEQIHLGEFVGGPAYAILTGGNVQQVANQFGITSNLGIRHLEMRAIYGDGLINSPNADPAVAGHAGFAVKRGENVRDMAEEFGITTHEGIVQLESYAIESWHPDSPGNAVRMGQNWEAVADQFGIHTNEGRTLLAGQQPNQVAQ